MWSSHLSPHSVFAFLFCGKRLPVRGRSTSPAVPPVSSSDPGPCEKSRNTTRGHKSLFILSHTHSLSHSLSLFDTLCKIFGAVCLSVQIKGTYALCHPETGLLPPPSQDFAAVATCPVSPRQGIETALSTRFPWKMCPLTIVPFALIFIQ